MKSFGERLTEARNNKGLSQRKLAELLDITPTRLNYWEKNKREPDVFMIKKISEILGVDSNYLLGVSTSKGIKDEMHLILQKYNALDDHGKEAVNSILDIEYNRIQQQTEEPKKIYPIQEYLERVSAGTGNYLDYTTAFITELGYEPPKEADFIVTVGGDSMEPTLYEGDRLFVQKVDCLEHGDIGIFFVPQEGLVVKECTPEGLVSHNKKYKIIKANPDIETIGKVIGKVR